MYVSPELTDLGSFQELTQDGLADGVTQVIGAVGSLTTTVFNGVNSTLNTVFDGVGGLVDTTTGDVGGNLDLNVTPS